MVDLIGTDHRLVVFHTDMAAAGCIQAEDWDMVVGVVDKAWHPSRALHSTTLDAPDLVLVDSQFKD